MVRPFISPLCLRVLLSTLVILVSQTPLVLNVYGAPRLSVVLTAWTAIGKIGWSKVVTNSSLIAMLTAACHLQSLQVLRQWKQPFPPLHLQSNSMVCSLIFEWLTIVWNHRFPPTATTVTPTTKPWDDFDPSASRVTNGKESTYHVSSLYLILT